MSQWTHVAVTIRFDGLPRGMSPSPDLGRTVHWDDEDHARKFRECDVPCGSEGSLSHTLREAEGDGLARWVATIWGDLREYEDADEIVAYLNRICEGCMIRDGVALIRVEYQETSAWRYEQAITDDGLKGAWVELWRGPSEAGKGATDDTT